MTQPNCTSKLSRGKGVVAVLCSDLNRALRDIHALDSPIRCNAATRATPPDKWALLRMWEERSPKSVNARRRGEDLGKPLVFIATRQQSGQQDNV